MALICFDDFDVSENMGNRLRISEMVHFISLKCIFILCFHGKSKTQSGI